MSFGVTLNTNRSYIDKTSIGEVAKYIFQNAENKSANIENTVDLSKFRRPEVGIDLYSQRTDIDTSRQIAIRNAGLDINLNENFIANVQYLNAQAAQNATKVQKNVEGKLAAPIAEGEKSEIKNIFNLPQTMDITNSKNLEKDKRGSNPFSFVYTNKNKGKEKQEEKSVNFVA